MLRTLLVVASLSVCLGQDRTENWAEALFQETSHDFGVVAGGSNASHAFPIVNSTDQPIRIVAFTASCGCTKITTGSRVLQPTVPGETITLNPATYIVLAPGQKSVVAIELDTRKFVGQQKSSTVVVAFDQPTRADVRLTVSAYIRQDVVLNPGAALFGSLARGQAALRTIDIEYAGTADLRIDSIHQQSASIDVSVVESYRREGGVGYQLNVHLKPNAPAGAIRDVIVLKTNDKHTPQIEIGVEGFIQPEIIATPTTLMLGQIKPGETVTRKVLLRASKPFEIVGVEGADDRLQAEYPRRAERLHSVTIRFKAGDKPGTFDRPLLLKTSLESEPPVQVLTRAQIAL